jgi:hypothetical protein
MALDNKLWPAALRNATGAVFHYTSANGLLAIAKTGTVRASEAASLNDLAEVRQGWAAIRRLLQGFDESPGRELLVELADFPLDAAHEVFMLCASTVGDDANQWRLYAEGGRGYALGLDATVQLCAYSKYEAEAPPPEPGRVSFAWLADTANVTPWLHVLYSENEVQDALAELLVRVDARFAYLQTVPNDDAPGEYETIKSSAHGALATIAHLVKSPGFVGENEVRVVATFVSGGDKIGYRSGANGIVGYTTLTQAPNGNGERVLRPIKGQQPAQTRLPLKSVRLGPLLSPEHPNTVKGFLGSLSLGDVVVARSQVPLR